ncbi:carbohydrate kinase family protein (plasmid) [Phyllobacterium sp. 628]|uniref:PfkB family carbohydrate kinase n=1 Tax=Phyllobacterium sp. 628 TaxID=2718938 RepID=UPI0016623719|nr:PfkB family carbohydrate kinase [Phyllobacterium sp. 628]QND50528.1 carbohydrate kinase family protein [Phyllobacterium sp. 628]
MLPLAVIGNVNVDLILGPADPWPTPGTEIMVDYDELRVGGSAGNSALTWEGLGVDFQIAANVGTDQFGEWLQKEFGSRAERWPVAPTGTTLSVGITHPNGERTFFTTKGHLGALSWPDVLATLDTNRLRGGYVLLCGSFLTDTLVEQYDAVFDWADANNIRIALDTGWPIAGWTEANRVATHKWLSRCHCALFNEVETTRLANSVEPADAARKLKALMPESAIVVVKCGPDGALAVGPDDELVSVGAPLVFVADTIGAGDVFNAAFLAALAREQTLQESITAGVHVASKAISTVPRRYDSHDLETLPETAL